jgi:hypothetical protein
LPAFAVARATGPAERAEALSAASAAVGTAQRSNAVAAARVVGKRVTFRLSAQLASALRLQRRNWTV